MSHIQPTMEYEIKVNGTVKELGSDTTVSLNEGFNKVYIKYRSTNQSISVFRVMVTPYDEDWGVNLGQKAFQNTASMSMNTWYEGDITLTSDLFTAGDGTYRLLLCAKGDLDGTWDVTVLLFTLKSSSNEHQKFLPSNYDQGVEMLTDEEAV